MFTASRATMISVSLVIPSRHYLWHQRFVTPAGTLYAALIIHALFLFGILAVANDLHLPDPP